jgi:hypothetical protein
MRRRWVKKCTLARVFVHTTAEDTIEGVLTGEYADGISLRDARYHKDDGGVSLKGEVFIPRSQVRFVQVP